jgi:hypothetical protein
MAINRVRKVLSVPDGSGEVAGFAIKDSNNRLTVSHSSSDGERNIPLTQWVDKTAAFTVTTKDDGKTFAFNSATSFEATLPASNAASKGMRVAFVVKTATAGAGHSVGVGASDTIVFPGLTLSAGDDIECDGASDRVGDRVELEADGDGKWFVRASIGTWSAQ